MTFGRPAMITRSWDISIPLMIDDEFLQIDGDGHQPSNIPSRMGLFVYSSKLYDILDKILITFYIEPETSKPITTDDSLQKLLSNVLTFNRQLDGFHNSTPEYLRLPAKVAHSGVHINSNIQLQAQILSCRFLYTRVILLRPLLLLSAQSNLRPKATAPNLWNIAALDRELAGYACNLCVKSAQELIENLHHNIETPYRISPWHTIYLSFAAAVVLIAAQRCPIIDPLAKKEVFDLSLGYCVAILAYHEPQIHSACEAIRVLQKLRNQMKNFQTQNAIDYGTNREIPNNSSSATDVPPETGIEHFAEPSQDWWNEFIPNGTEINSETWYSQHLINLDWLDIS